MTPREPSRRLQRAFTSPPEPIRSEPLVLTHEVELLDPPSQALLRKMRSDFATYEQQKLQLTARADSGTSFRYLSRLYRRVIHLIGSLSSTSVVPTFGQSSSRPASSS